MFDFQSVQILLNIGVAVYLIVWQREQNRAKRKLDNMTRAWNDVVALREQDVKNATEGLRRLEGKIDKLRATCNNYLGDF